MKIHCLPALFCLALAGSVFGAKVIPNHAIADLVLGQSDFVTGTTGNPINSFNYSSPRSIAIDPVSRKVFVADAGRRRILRYANASTLANGGGAEAVLGQTSFSESTAAPTAAGLSNPFCLFFDRLGRLWVSDFGHSRVLAYEAAAYRASSTNADHVYGQPNFTTVTSGVTATKMNQPLGVWVDSADRLWVSDFSNNRVLRFDSITTKPSGAPADGVLGQIDFTSNGSGSGSSKFSGPEGISVSSSGALFVADAFNNRVLRFDNAATLGNGAGANIVLGQASFATASSGTSSTTLDFPTGAIITPDDSLWVSEFGNNRLVRYDKASTKATGAAADGVLGQANFATSTAGTTARGLNSPFVQSFVDATGSIWVSDYGNNRVLRFPPDVTKPLLTLTGTVPKKTTSKSVVIKGTASDTYGISKIQYRIGSGALKTASGTTNWQFTAALKKGKNTITIFATDSVGNVSLNKVVKVKRS